MQWRVIPSFPDYEVNECGDIRRLTAGPGAVVGRPVTGKINRGGYRTVGLPQGSRRVHASVHRLVAEAFISPPPFDDAQVRHLDGSRMNNDYRNLAWGTCLQNHADRVGHGTDPAGERNGRAKLTASDIETIRRMHRVGGFSYSRIMAHFGISKSQTARIVTGAHWRSVSYA
jgi:hypothetical protein